MDLRSETTQAVRVFMMRTGMTLDVIGAQAGIAHQTMRQFVSGARFGTPPTKGEDTARRLSDWLAANPVALPPLEGVLHETATTRVIDALLEDVADGAWGRLYGPSGSQKTHLLRYRWAEAARTDEPRMIYIETEQTGFTPKVLLCAMGAALGVPYAHSTHAVKQQIYCAVRRRKTSLAIVVDEADRFYRQLDTLETLREVCDALPARGGRPGVGLLIVGNEKIMEIFRDRPGMYMEKWRGRISQVEERVIGPSIDEARGIVARELGSTNRAAIDKLIYGDKENGQTGTVVKDPVSGRDYVTAHGLFASVRRVQKLRNRKLN